jgi:signal transduction histidine kinase
VGLLPSGGAGEQDGRIVSRIQTSTLRKVAWSVGLISVALMLGGLALMFADRDAVLPAHLRSWDVAALLSWASNLAVPLLGLILATRRPQNPIGWLFTVAGVSLSLGAFGTAYAVHALRVDPGSLPGGYALAWISNWVWPIAVTMLIFLLLLFPDGHLRSRRWRPVAWLAGVTGGALVLGALAGATANWTIPLSNADPTSKGGALGVLITIPFVLAIVAWPIAFVAAFVSVILRYRRSSGEERLQLKWFVTAAGLVATSFAAEILSGSTTPVWIVVVTSLSSIFLYAAIAIAILKYRLYDFDVVIRKAVVFAVLAAFITAVYIGLVVGVGAAVGTSRSPLLSGIAAAVVAVAFQPVRERARKLANRVVYGKRATPYEVLSVFTERAAETYSTEDVLPRLVQVLAEGIGASQARVWLALGGELRPAAAWPPNGEVQPIPRPGDELPPFPERERAFPVRHGGELLGAISVVTSASDPLGPDRERLAEDVAAQTGLVLRNVRLIEELRESRRRIVAAQDVRAKALERNLHDGAQQQLVALAVKQRLAESFVERDPAKAKAMLGEIQEETRDALETLRDLARGIYPPLLADQGLEVALTSQVRRAVVPVEVSAEGVGRHSPEVESAVYFCCLEALQNVAKYAAATRAWIRLTEDAGTLRFEVGDDGGGFDPSVTSFGTGLQGMIDRLDAIGGAVRVESAPGEGTTVSGKIPIARVGRPS